MDQHQDIPLTTDQKELENTKESKKDEARNTVSQKRSDKDQGLWRDLVAYWVFGLCNNYGYVIMLTAAYDILKELEEKDGYTLKEPEVFIDDGGRYCNLMSTGAILLAITIPSILIKFTMPFLPFVMRIRVVAACSSVAIGLTLVALAENQWILFLGVAFAAMSCELGETSFLAYSANFNKNVISTWASGTGGAGVIGAFSYTLLRLVLDKKETILLMLVVPAIEILVFFFLLRKPLPMNEQITKLKEKAQELEQVESNLKPLSGFVEKFCYIKNLLVYIIPLTVVFLCEYFINQGLYELVYFPENILTRNEQYRWYQVTFQIGMFVARSSVNLIPMKQIWLLAILQTLNATYFMFEAIFAFTPSIWIIFALIFVEGFLGGLAYVNTYFTRLSKEVPMIHREFAMSLVVISGCGGITLAGFMAIPAHNWICGLPAPPRLTVL